MVYGSFIPWHRKHSSSDPEYEAITTVPIDVLLKDEKMSIKRIPDYFIVLHSHVSTIHKLHHPLFDFDQGEVTASYEIMCEKLKAQSLSGHLYSSLHGWHFYGDNMYHFTELIQMSKEMGCCDGQRGLAERRGYFSLRTGLKPSRDPDIVYIGHSSGVYHEKPLVARYHDYIDSIFRVNYYSLCIPNVWEENCITSKWDVEKDPPF